MKADLHIHSRYSDGKFSIKELTHYAKKRGIDVIAITDHDSVNAYNEAYEEYPAKILMGVEISASHNGEEIHVLGYFRDRILPTDRIISVLEQKQNDRKKRVHKVIEKLKKYYDIEISYEDIVKYADGSIARPHIAKAIMEKYDLTFDEIFSRFIGNDALAYVATKPYPVQEAIELLKNSNALVVLAHPKLIKKNNLEELINLGFDGIEVKHPEHTNEEQRKYRKYSKKYNLFTTGGSDFHEPSAKHADLGSEFIVGEELAVFLRKINEDLI